MKRRPIGLFLKGAGMGAADAVPGVSGGTIAFITGIYEELINTIKQFGPSAFGAWHREGWVGLSRHLNLAFLIPLLLGVAVSLVSVAHLALWLMEAQPLLLEGFFFGLVAASALVVGQAGERWKIWYLLPLAIGLMLAKLLPGMMPLVLMIGNEALVVIVAGAIAISAMLLPGVSGSFLLLTMGSTAPSWGLFAASILALSCCLEWGASSGWRSFHDCFRGYCGATMARHYNYCWALLLARYRFSGPGVSCYATS